jgi:hypothetical protein
MVVEKWKSGRLQSTILELGEQTSRLEDEQTGK